MGRLTLFILLIASFISYGQTFNMKDSRDGDTVQRIIQTTKANGIVKYLLITGTDTVEIRWDGTDLLLDGYNLADSNDAQRIDINNNFILGNVQNHGAIGDSATDCTAAFAAAMAAASVIYVPSGNYIVSNITLTKDLEIYGNGITSRIIMKSDAVDDLIICGSFKISLHDIELFGGIVTSQKAVATPPLPNLILNGEDWTGATGTTPPDNWNKAGTVTDFTIDGGMLRITGGAEGVGILQQPTVVAEKEYTLQFTYKNTDGDLALYRIVDATNAVDIVTTIDLKSELSNTVKFVNFTTPVECISVQIFLYSKTSGDIIWFDDVSLYKQDRSAISLRSRITSTIYNTIIHGFANTGIKTTDVSPDRLAHLSVINTSIFNCWTAVLVAEQYAEYHRYIGLDINNNYYGFNIRAGNILVSVCKVNDNGIGIYLLGTSASPNNAHGVFSNCLINHNTTAIFCDSVHIGHIFSGNAIFEGLVYLKQSKGISIHGGIFDVTTINLEGGGRNYIRDNFTRNGYGNTVNHNYNSIIDSTLVVNNFITSTTWLDGGLNVITVNDVTDITGSLNLTGQYNLSALNTAPSSAGDTGTLGEIRITADYIYVCTATNTWKRTEITTW